MSRPEMLVIPHTILNGTESEREEGIVDEATSCVLLKDLAGEWGLHVTAARRYIAKRGFGFVRVRVAGAQLGHALTQEDAQAVRRLRQAEGFGANGRQIDADTDSGCFYVVLVMPDFCPQRVKLGFTNDMSARLGTYQTVSPTAQVVRAWPCRRAWEVAVMASLTREGCKLIANEVFDCDEMERLLARGDTFFALMPKP